jgi:DNA uptake protein ComE-like DNA-binding protein
MGFFYFTKKERSVLLLLNVVGVAALVYLALVGRDELALTVLIPAVPEQYEYPEGKEVLPNDYAYKNEKIFSDSKTGSPEDEKEDIVLKDPFPFDPNEADKETLMSLGFSARTAATMLRYREKGGKFYKKEDVLKIYGVDSSTYARLTPFIQLENSSDRKQVKFNLRVDINQADKETWKLLPGIGEVYAGRICKFRDLLGGFAQVSQIGETYNLPDSVFQKILPFLDASPVINKLKINQLSKDALSKHPYINFKQSGLLYNYRQHHGPYKGREDILKSRAFNESELDKIEPYLSYDEE